MTLSAATGAVIQASDAKMSSGRKHEAWDLGFRVSLLAVLGMLACGDQSAVQSAVWPDEPSVDSSVPVDESPAKGRDAAPPPPEPPRPMPPPSAPPATVYARKNLYIVAHQDDDLGLMSPDLINRVRSGEPVRTVYLTSGDAGMDCSDYVLDREAGVKLAYAQMAGVPSVWDEREVEVLGKLARELALRGTEISLLFFGLHNGGYNITFQPDLEMLWSGGRPLINSRTLDGRSRSDTYTRSELIAVLHQLLVDWQPTHVNTLDSSRLQPMVWPFDHSDHVHSALFAIAALMQYERPHTVGMYRAYNELFEQPNVSDQAAAEKLSVFQTYLAHDPKICDGSAMLCGVKSDCDLPAFYNGYEYRQYRTVVFENVSGLLRAPLSNCVVGDGEQATVKLATCDRADRAQQWKVSDDGTLVHLSSRQCLDSGAGTRGTVLALAPCVNSVQQRFMLTTQHQLRGPDGTCVQAAGGTMTLQECTLDPRQLDWAPGMYPAFVTGLIEGLTNWEIPDWISYYGTLSFGDVDGDGDDDLCVRRGDGVYCAFADGAGFSSFERALDGFRDDQGWYDAAYGSTVQLGDIDGDGADELCGRDRDGVYCADWNSLLHAFDEPSKRSDDFTDAQGYGVSASRYRSLRIVDLNGDGMGDLCARNELGIACARSSGMTFAPTRMWTTAEFSDAQGWAKDEYGTTLRYGDVDGDGDYDVCGRNKDGILCARNDGTGAFVDPHLWSHTGDFGDRNGWNKQLSYYGSIRLADIDRDGNTDVCGRGPLGLLCSLSTGVAFTVAISLGSADAFSDASGWLKDRYGSTLGLMDLNLDGFADLCAWGPGFDGAIGLNCSLAE